MTNFVGAEYLIACMLIEKRKKGIGFVSLDELAMYGVCVQKMSVKEKIDAIFLTSKSQFYNAIYDFSDYFEGKYDTEEQFVGIKIRQAKNVESLEYRFIGYLPQDIFRILREALKQVAA